MNPLSPAVVVFDSQVSLVKAVETVNIGTLAFVLSDELLYIKSSGGWRTVVLGPTVFAASTATPKVTEPTSTSQAPIDSEILLPPANVKLQGLYLRMIALNAPQTGRMMSTNGADEMCWRQAHAANLTGEFTAFISNRFQHVYTIVPIRNRNLPVGNLQGDQLFPSWNSIFTKRYAFNPAIPIYSFNGTDVLKSSVWPFKHIWHGSKENGNKRDRKNCRSWLSRSSQDFSTATALNGRVPALDQEEFPCSSNLIVLCVEVNPRRRRKLTLRSKHKF